MKSIPIVAAFIIGASSIPSLNASAILFTDSVDVAAVPSAGSYTLDTSAYANSVIGNGPWFVVANAPSSISNFELTHYIFLFGSGVLESVKVRGTTSGAVNFTARDGTPFEEVFFGSIGETPNEYIFELNTLEMYQGGSTLISGFDMINKITFTGSYTEIPEPASAGTLLGILFFTSATYYRRNHRK